MDLTTMTIEELLRAGENGDEAKWTTASAEATREIGAALGCAVVAEMAAAQRAQVVTLSGDLGAGKTTFAQGFLGALGAEGPYTSPTFTIMKTYELSDGRTAYHIDPYRIGVEDLQALGWEEMCADSRAIILLEWPSIVAEIVPESAVRVTLAHVDEATRTVRIAVATKP